MSSLDSDSAPNNPSAESPHSLSGRLRSIVAQTHARQEWVARCALAMAVLVFTIWFYGIFYSDLLVKADLFQQSVLLILPLTIVSVIGLYLHRREADFLYQQQVLLFLNRANNPVAELSGELAEMINSAEQVELQLGVLAKYTTLDSQNVVRTFEVLVERLNQAYLESQSQNQTFRNEIDQITHNLEQVSIHQTETIHQMETQYQSLQDKIVRGSETLQQFHQEVNDFNVASEGWNMHIQLLRGHFTELGKVVMDVLKNMSSAQANKTDLLTLQHNLDVHQQQIHELVDQLQSGQLEAEKLYKLQTVNLERTDHHTQELHKIQEWKSGWLVELTSVIEKAEQTNEEFKTIQTNLLQRQDQAGRGVFLQSAQYILQDLHATAMDIVRQLDGQVVDDDWRAFNRGQRNIFTRKLLGKPADHLAQQLELRMMRDTELQNFVVRFTNEFDRLVDDAEDLDREGFLYALLITSDIGKLAILLKKAQGKLG